MKIKVLSILFLSSLIFFSCAKEEEMKKFEASVGDDRIASIEQQIDSINNTVVQLEKLNTALNKYVSTMQDEIDSVKITQSKDRESIAKMELAVAEAKAVNEKVLKEIDVLHSYVDESMAGVKGWAESTFMTMEYYDTLCAVVSQVKVDMARVSKDMDSLRADMRIECAAIVEVEVAKAVERVEASIKEWVNEKLTGYWTIEQTQAALNAVEKKALDSIGVVKSDLQTQIDSARAQLTRGYQAAIKQAIEEYDGVIMGVVKDSIAAVNTRINALTSRIDALTARVTTLEDQVAKLVARIQSIVPVPDYEDGSIKLQGDSTGSVIRFKVLPASAIDTIVKYGISYLSVEYTDAEIITKSNALSSLTVTKVEKEDNLLKITVKNEELGFDYWLGRKTASTCLTVGSDDSKISTAFFTMRCVPTIALKYIYGGTTSDICRDVMGCGYGAVLDLDVVTYPAPGWWQKEYAIEVTSSNTDIARVWYGQGSRTWTINTHQRHPGRVTINVKFGAVSRSFDIYVVSGWTYISGTNLKYYTIPGGFSVSPTKKVAFMQANAMYKPKSSSDLTLQPDCHQNPEDYVGNAHGNITLDHPQTLEDKVDLFGLSRDKGKDWGINSSTNDADYRGVFKDWGLFYSDSRRYFTLSKTEWIHLFSVRPDAKKKYGFGTIKNGSTETHGLIILPDTFVDPKTNNGNQSFVPGDSIQGWNANIYRGLTSGQDDWKKMLEMGAVFLPAAGQREGTTVKEANECGYYWTSTIDWNTDAHQILKFDSQKVYIRLDEATSSSAAHLGNAVHLVEEIE